MAVLGATSLTGCNSIPSFIAAGTKTIFEMATSPVSWTKDTSKNQSTLRVVSGSVSPGGSVPFPTIFTPAFPVSGSSDSVSSPNTTPATSEFTNFTAASAGPITVQPTSVSTAQITSHLHPYPVWQGSSHFLRSGTQNQGGSKITSSTQPAGGGGGHTHGVTGGTNHVHPTGIGPHSMTFTPVSHSHPFSASMDFGIQYVDMIVATKD